MILQQAAFYSPMDIIPNQDESGKHCRQRLDGSFGRLWNQDQQGNIEKCGVIEVTDANFPRNPRNSPACVGTHPYKALPDR
jgi:hypothetical protein